jgi:hypothetical protein
MAIAAIASLMDARAAFAQRFEDCVSSAAGEPTDPEGSTHFGCRGDTDRLPKSPPPGATRPPIVEAAAELDPATTPSPLPGWLEAILEALRRLGLVLPRGPGS